MSTGLTRRFRVVHRTRYDYALPVDLCHNEAHLEPRTSRAQRPITSRLSIDPPPDSFHRRIDYFGNPVATFSVALPRRRLVVSAESEVAVTSDDADDARLASSAPWEAVRDELRGKTDPESLQAREQTLPSPMASPTPELRDYAQPSFPAGRPIHEAAAELTRRIHADFVYEPGSSSIATPLADVFASRRGVCQDFAHLAIACVRSLGLPARYVSGYVQTIAPPGQQRVRGGDASHAWFAVYAPGLGWLDLDPTNDQVPPRQHITTAWGRDYGDVTPLRGVLLGGGEQTLEVSVDVEALPGD